MKISRLIYNESKWTKGCLGRTKDGVAISSFDVIHREGKEMDPTRVVESYSLQGAIIHLYSGDGQSEVFLKLSDVIRRYSGRKVYLAAWNDDPSTSFTDIKNVLEMANL